MTWNKILLFSAGFLISCTDSTEKEDQEDTTTDIAIDTNTDSDDGTTTETDTEVSIVDIDDGIWVFHNLEVETNTCGSFLEEDVDPNVDVGIPLELEDSSTSVTLTLFETLDCARTENAFVCDISYQETEPSDPISSGFIFEGEFSSATSGSFGYSVQFACQDGMEAECEFLLEEGEEFEVLPCELVVNADLMYCGASDDTVSQECEDLVDGIIEDDTQSFSGCGLVWPEDSFQVAVYSFIAEYALGLGAVVGCFLDDYPDQTYAEVAIQLEDGWMAASDDYPNALIFAEIWLNEHAEEFGGSVFDLIDAFELEVDGDTITGGLGFSEEDDDTDWSCEESMIEDDTSPFSGDFEVENNPNTGDPGMECLTRMVDVWGLRVYAESQLTNAQILHAASVLAELLDNDEDGLVDDLVLFEQLIATEAMMPMFNYDGSPAYNDFVYNYQGDGVSAVLFADEVDPSQPGYWGGDASVEEIMHTINHRGHVEIYPEAFGIEPDSSLLSVAMDVARGGQFLTVPSSYPAEAWYHYDDVTCDYGCMAIEYIYWAQVSNMGILNDAQTCAGIANEWEPCSPELLQSMDVLVYELITDPAYSLPQSAPDGVYDP